MVCDSRRREPDGPTLEAGYQDTFLKDRRQMKSHRSWLLQARRHSSPRGFGGAPAQPLSRVRLFVTPRTAAHQASLSITNSRSPPKPMSL